MFRFVVLSAVARNLNQHKMKTLNMYKFLFVIGYENLFRKAIRSAISN